MVGVGEGLFALQSLSTIKKVTSPLIPNQMSPFRSFCDNSFDTKCPGAEQKKK
jgi:hypothetical protein